MNINTPIAVASPLACVPLVWLYLDTLRIVVSEHGNVYVKHIARVNAVQEDGKIRSLDCK